MLGHAFVDLVAVGLQQLLGPGLSSSVVIEGVVGLFGLIAIWIIWRLRDAPLEIQASKAETHIPALAAA